jgi:hypothetical protein
LNARLFWLRLFWVCPLLTLPLAAQSDLSSYLGPGILSPGVGDLGDRSGLQVDLRFWGGVNAVYSTNLQPLTTDAQGNLIRVPNLIGTSANAGAYGGHHWQHAQLGLTYMGNYIYYPQDPTYDGTNQALTLGLTVQYSSRVVFDLRVSGAVLSQGTGAVADAAAAGGSLNGPQLFDSRASYVNVTGSMTLIQSPRTSYTFGAGANANYYQSSELVSASGYHLNASTRHRLSLANSIGASYAYSAQTGTGFSDQIQSFSGQYFGNFSRFWTVSVSAGISLSHVDQSLTPQLPVIGADGSVTLQSFPAQAATRNLYPTGGAELRRQFQRASASVSYNRNIGAGNGLFLAGITETAAAGISYTGVRKWNFGIDGHYLTTESLGQPPGKTTWYGGGTGVTYEIARYTHLTARFNVGHYDFPGGGYNRLTEQATLGIAFSSGNIPLSLW